MKVLAWVVGIIFAGFLLLLVIGAAVGPSASGPSQSEMYETAGKILTTCQIQVLGRAQREGERISNAQAGAIARCADGMGAAYIEGVKSGRR